jgi:hypothetical protein
MIPDLMDETNTPLRKQHIYRLAQIEINIGTTKYIALTDTGSVLNCLNGEVFQKILTTDRNLVSLLPVANVNLIGYDSKINRKVRKQALVTITVGGISTHVCFMIVENLYSTILIGFETLTQWRTVLDFNTFTACFEVNKHSCRLALKPTESTNIGQMTSLPVNELPKQLIVGQRRRSLTLPTGRAAEPLEVTDFSFHSTPVPRAPAIYRSTVELLAHQRSIDSSSAATDHNPIFSIPSDNTELWNSKLIDISKFQNENKLFLTDPQIDQFQAVLNRHKNTFFPYKITNLKSKNVYELSTIRNQKIKGWYNAGQIKPYRHLSDDTI